MTSIREAPRYRRKFARTVPGSWGTTIVRAPLLPCIVVVGLGTVERQRLLMFDVRGWPISPVNRDSEWRKLF
jgi:hypothetical protein